ncbi:MULTISPECIES: branched-chain amino acid ABC transporter substrate-binding protein [unclassified Streptomyces]|uniref:branched-chain amino acid ABC transporter substrate-binding protein n=1 Tax=unclassified Streptomyces TaxID=2593676 RepID=UPI001F037F9A|nr:MULTISPECIES: branched-chain amino acid ABC transporter substrate-binding protein [unclassified Streptomyces]
MRTARGTKTGVAAAFAAAALVLTGCQGALGSGGKDSDGPITLGMAIPISGSSAAAGPYMKNGAQLAIDEINADGGVLGRKLKLNVQDSACDPKTAVTAANKLVAAGVTVSVGGYCSSATLPTLSVFDKADIPMVVPAANSGDLVAQKLPNVFLINGTGAQQAQAAVEWMSRQKATRVALLDDNTSYSTDITKRTRADIEEGGSGMKMVLKESVNAGESDYGSNVDAIVKAKPDFVYWTGYYQEGGLLIRQLRQAGYKGDIMVADGNVDAKLISIAGKGNAQGVYATMTETPDTIEGASNWISDYKEKFGSEPGPYALQSYDAVRVAAKAIEDADGTDGKKIMDALTQIDGFKLFSGPLKFTSNHTLSQGGFRILRVSDTTFTLVDDLQS